MRSSRCAWSSPADLRTVAIGVVAGTVIAGCGGSSSASSESAPPNPAQSTPQSATQTTASKPQRVAMATPQRAVRSYIEGIQTANGALLCNVLDEGLRRALVQKIVSASPTEAGASCAQALTGLAASVTNPGESRLKLPPLQVTRTSGGAVVSYLGPRSHQPRTFTLVKRGPGWLIDKINGKG
jgi:hypothetical protein